VLVSPAPVVEAAELEQVAVVAALLLAEVVVEAVRRAVPVSVRQPSPPVRR